MIKWTIRNDIRVSVVYGLDIQNFLIDAFRVQKSILGSGITFNHFLRVPKGIVVP